jgi:hypothetical protein
MSSPFFNIAPRQTLTPALSPWFYSVEDQDDALSAMEAAASDQDYRKSWHEKIIEMPRRPAPEPEPEPIPPHAPGHYDPRPGLRFSGSLRYIERKSDL